MAKLDFALRTEHYKTVPDHKVYQSQGQFKMFNSAMIAGISAIIDPRGPDGDTMRKILGTFLELNPWIEVKSKDETTRKEVRIVSFFFSYLTPFVGGICEKTPGLMYVDSNSVSKSCADIRKIIRSR